MTWVLRRDVGARLAGRRDAARAALLEQALGLARPVGVVRVHREEDPAALDEALVALGFVLRYAHADERADDATDGAADAGTGQGRHDRTRRDERAEVGDG